MWVQLKKGPYAVGCRRKQTGDIFEVDERRGQRLLDQGVAIPASNPNDADAFGDPGIAPEPEKAERQTRPAGKTRKTRKER